MSDVSSIERPPAETRSTQLRSLDLRERGALPGCSPSQAAGGCGGGGLGGASRVQAAILVREHPL